MRQGKNLSILGIVKGLFCGSYIRQAFRLHVVLHEKKRHALDVVERLQHLQRDYENCLITEEMYRQLCEDLNAQRQRLTEEISVIEVMS
ncbi:MAG TPA: hypothetical protein ENN05_00420 [Deltaproteobacteria bacterium]|nr:hypothetical protein [Deltaproteobacteria bacterium]